MYLYILVNDCHQILSVLQQLFICETFTICCAYVVYNRSCELFCLLIGFVCWLFLLIFILSNYLYQFYALSTFPHIFFFLFFFHLLLFFALFFALFFGLLFCINLLHKIHVTRRATQTDDQNVRNRFACCFVENKKTKKNTESVTTR